MINFFAPLNSLGIGTHAFGMMKALDDLGEEIAVFPPFGNVNRQGENVERWLLNRERFHRNSPSVMIFDVDFLPHFSGIPRIGFVVMETDGLTPRQLAAVKSCDFIITPSKWNQRVLAHHAIESTVIHEGFDPEVFQYYEPKLDDGSHIKFLHVGKFEERKGTIQTIRAFFLALERHSAELILHCNNPFMADGGYNQIATEICKLGFQPFANYSGQPCHIFIYGGLRIVISEPREDIAFLYPMADCGIFPSKGEGWNLPLMECIVSGIPAITGNWTGQSEYLGDDYPAELTLKDYSLVTANDGVWYHGNRGNWYVPETKDLVERITWAHQNVRKFRHSEQWKEKIENIRSFTWEKAAKDFLVFLKDL